LNTFFFVYLDDYRYLLKGYHGERRGEREDMQDAHVMLDDFTSHFTTTSLPNTMWVGVAYFYVLST